MAPPKSKTQKMSLGDFLGDQSLGSWADEMEDMPVSSGGGSGYGVGRSTYGSGGGFGADRGFGGDRPSYADRGFATREELPLPTKPPYTAHVGNLSFDATEGDIQDFFGDCEVTNVRIVEDKLERKPKGFGYVEFGSVEGLKKALALSGSQFQGRNVRVSVAEPPKERHEQKDMSDWTRKGPLPDLPNQRRVSERGYNRGFDAASDAGSERGERRRPPPFDGDGKVRDFGNWERKGPLSPAAAPTGGFREGGRTRTHDAPRERKLSPAWGEGRSQDGSRPPRREFHAERAPSAAELDNQWRSKMKSPSATPETSVPSSPAPQPVAPATRPKLNLAKRTVSEVEPALPSASSDSKPNPFGAARPIDTAAREKEVEERRQLSLRLKKEAEEKAREEKKAKEAAEKATKEKASPAQSAKGAKEGDDKSEIIRRGEGSEGAKDEENGASNGEIVDDKAVKPKEIVRDPPAKTESSWRRGPAAPAAPAQSTTQAVEEDGWSTVTKNPKSNRRGGPGRAIAS